MVPPAPATTPIETVLAVLESLGQRSETEVYLKRFLELPKESFALVAVGNPVVRHAVGPLSEDLRFLADLGLFAPVLLGLLDQGASLQLAQRLEKRLAAVGLEQAIYAADTPGLTELVRADLRAGRAPILWFERDPARTVQSKLGQAAELVEALDTQKVVLLRRSGGLKAQAPAKLELAPGQPLELENGVISLVNLRSDASLLLQRGKLSKQDAGILASVQFLLERARSARLMVNVASPLNLLTELFTVKGAGTLVKQGARIARGAAFSELDQARLCALLEQSFGKPLLPSFFEAPPLGVYLEEEYRGCAVVVESEVGAYLSKFAVEPLARGEGIAQDLWRALCRDFSSFAWRARPHNPIGPWYARICTGMVKAEHWHVFWRGQPKLGIEATVAHALVRPSDFDEGPQAP